MRVPYSYCEKWVNGVNHSVNKQASNEMKEAINDTGT